MTIWIITIITLRETLLSNHHTLQFTEPSDVEFTHVHERFVANHNTPHTLESGQVKHSERGIVADPIVENDLSHVRVQGYQIIQIAHCRVRVVSWQIWMTSQGSNVYLSQMNEVSTSSHRYVILVLECIWEIHIGETGHIYTSFHVNKDHSRE